MNIEIYRSDLPYRKAKSTEVTLGRGGIYFTPAFSREYLCKPVDGLQIGWDPPFWKCIYLIPTTNQEEGSFELQELQDGSTCIKPIELLSKIGIIERIKVEAFPFSTPKYSGWRIDLPPRTVE